MKGYEKKSFIQIFLGYFISITIFILLLGFLYFNQQKTFLMQKTAMNMHQYLFKLQQSGFRYTQEGYTYKKTNNAIVKKQLPQKQNQYYIKTFSNKFTVKLESYIVDTKLKKLKYFTILLQAILLIIFAIISYVLARRSLKPMMDTISHLDRFTKDLIHDLNTPITSILLNTKMLKKDADEKVLKKINRIENSAKNISSLYENIETLLDDNILIKNEFDLSALISNTIEIYKLIYPNINFIFNEKSIQIYSNQNALKRIIDNIISNGCKYSLDTNPIINIEYKNNILSIKDNGKGIIYPQKVFERSYKENEHGHGIGMHIVHRLCDKLNIKIEIISEEYNGTEVKLQF